MISDGEVARYDPALHGRVVYVGQTIRDLLKRDAQHLYNHITQFDGHYNDRAQYVLVMLDQRRFAPAASTSAFLDDTLRPAAEWMDVRERRFIDEFDTYRNGWNSTTGGQGRGWLVALREARAKQTYLRFRDKYMPAFRAYYQEQTPPHVNAPQSHPVLGKLLSDIRTGSTAVPPQFEEELLAMGLDVSNQRIVQRDARWANKYMPAFRAHYQEQKHVNAQRSHPVLGTLLHNIRKDGPLHACTVPPEHEEELKRMGLLRCTQNLACHVVRTLGHPVVSLEVDAEAKAEVTRAAKLHADMRAARSKLCDRAALIAAGLFRMPFGNGPLGDGMARFHADLVTL